MKVYKSEKWKERIWTTYDELIANWGIPVQQEDIATPYGTTHVNICGVEHGAPLVLFHGVGDDAALMWIYNAAELGKHFRIYAIDTIGGPGKSVPNQNYVSEFDDIRWIDAVLDGLNLKQVNIAGVSNGGYLVQYYMVKRPERVIKGLAMAAGVAVSRKGSPIRTMMKVFLPEALFPTRKNVMKLLRKMTGENSAAFTENPLLLRHFTELMHGFQRMAMKYHNVSGFSDEEVDSIRDKCMYYIGEDDPFSLLGGRKVQLEYHMNTEYFPKTGHGINHERSDMINQKMIRYFQ